MTDSELIYNAFFRDNPPSLFRLAIKQVNREGVIFKDDPSYYLNLVIDRAITIRQAININIEDKNGVRLRKIHSEIVGAKGEI